MEDGLDILLAYVEECECLDDELRSLLTITLLVTDDIRIWQLLKQRGSKPVLQEGLLKTVLTAGKPLQVAKVLWSGIGSHMSPELFRDIFQATSARTSDLAVEHQLLGAATNFMLRYPDVVQFTPDSIQRLLKSSDVDHRIIGLKAVCRHSLASLADKLDWIAKAINAETDYEQGGGLEEFCCLLKAGELNTNLSKHEQTLAVIAAAITRIVNAPGQPMESLAWPQSCLRQLRDLQANSG